MKKLLSTLFSTLQGGVRGGLLLLLLVASVSAIYASDTQVDGIWYDFDNSTKTASVTYRGSKCNSYSNEYSGSVIIPETVTYNGTTYSVTSIGNYAFYNCTSLTSVTIPNSVTSIGDYAFEDCSSLTSVTIGESVTSIGDGAFSDCSSLTSVTIPNSVTSIERQAFSNCSSLSSITIPESVTNLEYDAFYKCYFAADNFVNYSSQQSFGGAIIVDADINGLLITDSTLVKCRPNVVSAEVPEGVKSIESSAFKESPLLTTITIGNDVKTIGVNAFEKCKALTSVVITDSVQTINDKAFLNCTSLSSVSISDATTYIGKDAFAGTAWFDNKPDGVVYINNVLYKYKGTMPANTSVTIKDGTLFISPSAFQDCSSLSAVTIPDGVLGIGSSAFYGCSSLTEITIPYSVLLVQTQAFDHCYSLSSVKWNAKGIPNVPPEYTGGGMPSLGDGWIVGGFNYTNIFNEGSYVTSFVFGDSVEHIPAHLCQEMEGLRSVTLPKSVATIGEKAFFSCLSLTEITIPENVTYIAHFAFGNCPALSSVTWNAKKCRDFYRKIGNVTGGTPNDYPFYNGDITSLTFGDSVEYIPAFLCYKMDEITTINIPNSVDSIGEYAFFGCSSLTKTNYTGDIAGWCNIKFGSSSANPMYCSHNFYINDQEIKDLVIPNSVDSIHDYAFYNCSSLTSVTIPNSVTSIGYAAFRDCSSLTSVTIPNSLTSIGDYAFYDCTSLTSVTIPNSLTSIGDHAFYDCTSLASVVWNAINYTSDASSVFEGDVPSQITSFVFGDSVKYIPSWLCGGMSSLTSITIPNSVTSIGEGAFAGCSSLSSITIPNSVTSMGEYAFRNCKSLSSVVIGNSVTKIRTETFKDCSSLTSVTIGKKVKEIGTDAFYGCSALTQTNYTGNIASWCQIAFGGFSSNPTYYSKNLFINGEEVKDVVIPNTVSSISKNAFYNCEKISSLTIPESVTSIGYNAFAGCKKLFDIYCYPTTPPEAQENSFANYNVNLYVPCDNLRDYQMDIVFGSFKYIQCLEDTPPSEPRDTIIYHPTVYDVICEGDEYYWMGMQFTEAGRYEVVEIVEEEDYIYHNIYTLELTVIPPEIVVLPEEEAYDSYEWHGEVYTESGTYFYEDYCYQEILHLTIIPSPGTAVDNMQTDSDHSAQKILRDQQILILRDGKIYSIMGQEM